MSSKAGTAKKVHENSAVEEAAAIGQRAKGALKEKVGSLIGDEEMEHEGREENLEGRLRQENNEVLPNGKCASN